MNLAALIRNFAPALVLALCLPAAAQNTNTPPPATAREFYNAGTRLLAAKKFPKPNACSRPRWPSKTTACNRRRCTMWRTPGSATASSA